MRKEELRVCLMLLCLLALATGCVKKEKREVQIQMQYISQAELNFLPLGSIKPKGWLKNQLEMQRDNITGQFEDISPDVLTVGEERSGWLGGSGESWERGPYYVRGLVLLSYTLGDDELIEKSQKWIDSFIDSQTESGAVGPYADKPEFDYWAVMPMLLAVEDYYDATRDVRVISFLDNYFKYQNSALDKTPLEDWAKARAGDNILAAMWLYEKTQAPYLLELCKKLYLHADNWENSYYGWNNFLQFYVQ